MDEIFQLRGMLSLTKSAGFLIPVFLTSGSNHQFVQNIRRDGIISEFLILPPECIADGEPYITPEEGEQRKVADEAIYAVRLPGVFEGTGNRTEIESRVRVYLSERDAADVSSTAFFRVQAYKFLRDYSRARREAETAANLFAKPSTRTVWCRAELASIRAMEVPANVGGDIAWLEANFDHGRWAQVWLKNYRRKDADHQRLEELGVRWLDLMLGGHRYCTLVLRTLLGEGRVRDKTSSVLIGKFGASQKEADVWLPYLVELPGTAPEEIVEFSYHSLLSYLRRRRSVPFSSRVAFETWQLIVRSAPSLSGLVDATWQLLDHSDFRPTRKLQFWNYLARRPEQGQRLIEFGRHWLGQLAKPNAQVFAKVWIDIADRGGLPLIADEGVKWLGKLRRTPLWPEIWRRMLPSLGSAEGPRIAKTWLNSIDRNSESWTLSWLKIQSILPDDEELIAMGHRYAERVNNPKKGRVKVLERLEKYRGHSIA